MSIRAWKVARWFAPRVLGAAVTALGMSLAVPASAEVAAPELLSEAKVAKDAGLPSDTRSSVVRKYYANVKMGELDRLKAAGKGKVRLNLFDDYAPVVQVEEVVSRSATRYTLRGSVDGNPQTSVFVARVGNAVMAEVRTPGGDTYEVRHRGNGIHEVMQVVAGSAANAPLAQKMAAPAVFPDTPLIPEADGGLSEATKKAVVQKAEGDDDGAIIDLLAVYTVETSNALGGEEGAIALVDLDVAQLNWALEISYVIPRAMAVETTVTTYTEYGFIIGDLDRVSQNNEDDSAVEAITWIHEMRDFYKADLVTLYVGYDEEGSCGVAYQYLGADAEDAQKQGFNVLVATCPRSLELAKQFGHSMGAGNVRNEDGTGNPGVFSYSHGHRFFVGDNEFVEPNTTYTTIMGPDPSKRLPFFSNPKVAAYQGGPLTGVLEGEPGEADNAKALNQTCRAVATFRNGGSTGEPSIAHTLGETLEIETLVGQNPPDVPLQVRNKGTGFMYYEVDSASSWISVSPGAFESNPIESGFHVLSFNTSHLLPGIYADTIQIQAPRAEESVVEISVRLTVKRECSYAITPIQATLGHTSNQSGFAITAQNQDGGCAWTATASADWITLLTPSGIGSGTVSYTVSANPTRALRVGTITVGGHTHTIYQTGYADSGMAGALSGYKDVQKTVIRSLGRDYFFSGLVYNFDAGTLLPIPTYDIPVAVAFTLPHNQWVGIYAYDYVTGQFTQATYRTKQSLP